MVEEDRDAVVVTEMAGFGEGAQVDGVKVIQVAKIDDQSQPVLGPKRSSVITLLPSACAARHLPFIHRSTGVLGLTGDVHRARDLAQRLLMDLPERWRHTIGVARRAERVADTVGSRSEGDILLAAAWLHDTGYAVALRDPGFHPIDGARHLQGVEAEVLDDPFGEHRSDALD